MPPSPPIVFVWDVLASTVVFAFFIVGGASLVSNLMREATDLRVIRSACLVVLAVGLAAMLSLEMTVTGLPGQTEITVDRETTFGLGLVVNVLAIAYALRRRA